jgi:long-chain acyl-CoA synthetase
MIQECLQSFWTLAKAVPDSVALVLPDGEEVRAGVLLSRANQLVFGLRALGLVSGDCIAAVLPNGSALVELCLAAMQAGWYLTPINHHLTAPEISYILKDSDAQALFFSPRYEQAVRAALAGSEIPPERRFLVGEPGSGQLFCGRPYKDVTLGQPTTTPAQRTMGLAMTYTSGTTGQPRGVRRPLAKLSPEVMAQRFTSFLMLFGIKPGVGVHLCVSPLYHTAVLSFCLASLHLGHTVVLLDHFTAEGTLERIERYGISTSHMVPTQFKRLLDLPDEVQKRYDLSSLQQVIHGAAPCPAELKRRMLSWWGPVIYEYYSASEGGGTLVTPAEWLERPGTVGLPWPQSEIRIYDDAGQPCGSGQVGTVYIRMTGSSFAYHKDQTKTAAAWRGEFFTVGDAGYLDDAGYLFLCDRKVDMIISGGVNIYPAEIEAVLLGHSQVADAAVFGIPDDDWGEAVKAVIELQDAPRKEALPVVTGTHAELEAELRAFCKERLAGYKCPRFFEFTAALPRDPNGKLYKRKLRDPHWQGRERAI